LLGGGYLLYQALPTLITLASNTLYFAGLLAALAAVIYMVLDPKMRNLVWYVYKSIMRAITGVFVQIDPIGILKSYIEDLKDNLGKMNSQISNLKGPDVQAGRNDQAKQAQHPRTTSTSQAKPRKLVAKL
jgi:hypothetical protein